MNANQSNGASSQTSNSGKQIVEVNPISPSREAPGSVDFVAYYDSQDERLAIESYGQQLQYMKSKLVQLTNGFYSTSAAAAMAAAGASNLDGQSGSQNGDVSSTSDISLVSQTSLSILIINSLDIERHSSRIACRATTRANTEEVTTVVKVQSEYDVRALHALLPFFL